MIPHPIHRVLSTLRNFSVRFLLSGGQACILYGGTEFSRDADVVVTRIASRPWLAEAAQQGERAVEQKLLDEERRIRADDRAYWQPLREELERMRLSR